MSLFDPKDALEALRAFLDGRGLQEATLSVCDGFEAMLDFYRDVQARGCAFEDADMLLFQWGTHATFPRPGGVTYEAFDLNLTRQLILNQEGEDEDIWQLELNFDFVPNEQLRALGSGNRWCSSLHELPSFREYVLASPSVTTCSQLQVRHTTLRYGCAG